MSATTANSSLPALAAKESNKESIAKTFLSAIYRHYLGSSRETAAGVSLANANTVRGYFTVGMASLIIDDRATAAKLGVSEATARTHMQRIFEKTGTNRQTELLCAFFKATLPARGSRL